MKRLLLVILFFIVTVEISYGEEIQAKPGKISGRISPHDVSITIVAKIAGTSPEGDNVKGVIQLPYGGNFTFDNIPPGKYDLLFYLSGESRYTYFAHRWSEIVVEAGKTTSGINYRLTPQHVDHLIDEVSVEFGKDFPHTEALKIIESLNCKVKDEPLVLDTVYYLVDIPDDRTVDEMIKAFKGKKGVIDASYEEITPSRKADIEGKLLLNIREHYGDHKIGEANVAFYLATEKIYGCSNFEIMTRSDVHEHHISIEATGILMPGICLTSLGPASGGIGLTLSHGDYSLQLTYGDIMEKYTLSITDASITMKESSSSLDGNTLWRRPRHSFVYLCGTTTETSWICDDFLKTLQSQIELEEIFFPESGQLPYPRTGGGHQYDMPARFCRT